MLLLAFVVFLAVALGGDLMTIQIVRKKPIPAVLPTLHWVAALAGLLVLLVAIATTPVGMAGWIAAALFAAGFLGGWLLFRVWFAGQRPPLLMVVAHSTLGVAGLVALALEIWG